MTNFPKLFALIIRHLRFGLLLLLLFVSAQQLYALLHAPAGTASAHVVVAIVFAAVGARLYLAKGSQINRGLAALEQVGTHNRKEV